MTSDNVSPIRNQYLKIKKQYPDTILFFRLGDFYETFDNDAEITSKELEIVLTSRNIAKGVKVPMAGIPYHAVENYLSRLIEKGYHVAICEQIGTQPVNGLVPREVVRVITPGTVIEPGLLQSGQNNYLVSIFKLEDRAGISYVDISTGEFSTTEIEGKDIDSILRAELMRIKPAEVLMPEGLSFIFDLSMHITYQPTWRFEYNRCCEILLNQFRVASLDGFGLRKKFLAIQAAGVIIQYLKDTQSSALNLLQKFNTYDIHDFMILDAVTRRNLELTETIRAGETKNSLLSVLDCTVTPMGKRLLRQWVSKPLLDIRVIKQRQDQIEYLFNNGLLRNELRTCIKNIVDIERLVNRVISRHAGPKDLISIRNTLLHIPSLISIFSEQDTPLENIINNINPCEDILLLLEKSISEDTPATLQNSGVIKPEYSEQLSSVLDDSRHAREWIANLENIEKDRTGIKSLKVGYNKVFGYYIEVTNSYLEQVPKEYIRKQTLVNAERYITPEMKEYESLVLTAEDRIREIENRLFYEICDTISSAANRLLETANCIAEIDVIASLSDTAANNKYVRPIVTVDNMLDIRESRHPVVELSFSSSINSPNDKRFVPNDAVYETGEIVRIITGPNMSGKSTFLRQIGLIILMAQMGSFVPASSATIGLVDRIFTRIGAQDEIHAGQSTFMVEMIETANILNHATARSLLILDEIGRGTSTYDGVSIAWSVIEYIHNHPALRAHTLFATHYHELTQLSDFLPGVRNYNVAVSESGSQPVFLHKIIPGSSDRSYGIHVAQIAGMPVPVIHRASEILHQLEASAGKVDHIESSLPQQLALFPETNPLLEELEKIDLNTLSPLEALNRLYEWKKQYLTNS